MWGKIFLWMPSKWSLGSQFFGGHQNTRLWTLFSIILNVFVVVCDIFFLALWHPFSATFFFPFTVVSTSLISWGSFFYSQKRCSIGWKKINSNSPGAGVQSALCPGGPMEFAWELGAELATPYTRKSQNVGVFWQKRVFSFPDQVVNAGFFWRYDFGFFFINCDCRCVQASENHPKKIQNICERNGHDVTHCFNTRVLKCGCDVFF